VIAWTAMAVVGAFAALLRYQIGLRWSAPGILAVNLSGTFVLGVLTGAAVHGTALLILGTGFCGAYTTFSTWMVERRYLAVAVAGGLATGTLGWLLGSLF
jgi:CrcB protein